MAKNDNITHWRCPHCDNEVIGVQCECGCAIEEEDASFDLLLELEEVTKEIKLLINRQNQIIKKLKMETGENEEDE